MLPLIEIGAQAVHVPFHTTWQHEEVKIENGDYKYLKINKLSDIVEYLK